MSVFTLPARARASRSDAARARASRPGAAVAAISVLASAGYLMANLLPIFLDAVRTGLGLSGTAAGAIGTAVLLASALAGAGITRAAGRAGRERPARAGLLLMVGGFTLAALTGSTWLAVTGAIVGGAGSGMALTVATAAMAGTADPARTSGLALLAVALSGTALYVLVPVLGGGRGATVGVLAAVGLGALPMVRHLPAPAATLDPAAALGPAPQRRTGLLLTTAVGVRSVAMNALWAIAAGVGTDRVGLSAAMVSALCAACLLAGVVGVVIATSVGRGRARTVPLVTAVGAGGLAALALTLAPPGGVALYAVGLLGWNASCQAVTTYVLGVAAGLDARGRWSGLAMSANTFGTACGPIVGLSALAAFGAPATGALIALTAALCTLPFAHAARTADTLTTANTNAEALPHPGEGPDAEASAAMGIDLNASGLESRDKISGTDKARHAGFVAVAGAPSPECVFSDTTATATATTTATTTTTTTTTSVGASPGTGTATRRRPIPSQRSTRPRARTRTRARVSNRAD
ncbi:MFS transporter [Embleya sp. NPDC127516]|uniref:MFS transporter n=1 Tax=Embleya sp. NPDC127516 TaxID=3363990 RepID=UPI0037FBD96E